MSELQKIVLAMEQAMLNCPTARYAWEHVASVGLQALGLKEIVETLDKLEWLARHECPGGEACRVHEDSRRLRFRLQPLLAEIEGTGEARP